MSLAWGDVKADTPVTALAAAAPTPAAAASSIPAPVAVSASSPPPTAAVDALAQNLASAATIGSPADDAKEDDSDAAKLNAFGGLHPNDNTAQVTVTVAHDDSASSSSAPVVNPSIFQAVESFEQLGLSKELLSGVYAMKYTAPSKIQAKALPIIMAPNHPNLIGQAHAGSGKTATFSLGILSRIDVNRKVPQAIVLCPVRELAVQVAEVIRTLAQYLPIEVFTAVPVHPPKKERVNAHVIVGTPGTVDNKIRAKELDTRGILMFVADEADQMIAQEGLGDKTVQIKKQLPKTTQILLFSATFDEPTRKFAKVVAPNAVEIMVKTEELSLDTIKQYFLPCQSVEDKIVALTQIYFMLETGSSIIFVHTVATAKTLANRMRKEGFSVSLLHGKDMKPDERDRVMNDFRKGTTNILITTNVLARGIDVLAVTLVINFDMPLSRNGKVDPETYIHRIGRTGRFGRMGVAINLIHDQTSKNHLASIASHFKKDINALPRDDFEKVKTIVDADIKAAIADAKKAAARLAAEGGAAAK